jgi:hypothetical protein
MTTTRIPTMRPIPPQVLTAICRAIERSRHPSPVAIVHEHADGAWWGALYQDGDLRVARSSSRMVTLMDVSECEPVPVAMLDGLDRAAIACAIRTWGAIRGAQVLATAGVRGEA